MKPQPTNRVHGSSLSGAEDVSVRSLSLRTKMAFSFGALFAVILLVVSLVRTFGLPWTSDRGSYGLEQSLALKQLDLLADLKKERLRLWLEERKYDATELAERPVIVSSVRNLLELIQKDGGPTTSQEGLKIELLDNKNCKALVAALKGLKVSHSGYEKIRIVNGKNGLVLASTDENDIGLRISGPQISSAAMNPGGATSVIVTKSPETGRMEVVFSRAIPDRSSTDSDASSGLSATVMLQVDGERFLKPYLFGDARIGESEDIVLVDRDRRLLISTGFSLQGGEQARPMEYVVRGEPSTLAVQGKEGALVTWDYRDVQVLAAYRYIQLSPNNGWGLVVKIDQAEILGPSKRRLLYASVISLLGVLAASVMGALLAGMIARPIQNLSRTAREVEAGNLKARATVAGSDEVGELAATFNSMIERVHHWQAELEEQVTIRTRRLTELNEELKTEIRERTRAEQERERLIRELETKNAELERFTYTVSHDLSSPLITIKTFAGFVDQALRDGKTDDVESDLQRIRRAAEKMGQLLEELLELSRIGRLVNPPTQVAMTKVAREAVELLGGIIAERGVDVVIASDMPTVRGDRPRLLEVFQNLVENALKFTKEQPHPTIEIGVGDSDGEPAFYVRDNGEGIDPAYQERIFRLFDKLDQNSEGTGIGLAIVKRIIEVHEGRIWVESQGKGQGSTFWFTLSNTGPADKGECK